jgi:hypothetical protein
MRKCCHRLSGNRKTKPIVSHGLTILVGGLTLLADLRLTLGDGTGVRDGKIDDVRVYNRVLSASEVKQLYLLGGARIVN